MNTTSYLLANVDRDAELRAKAARIAELLKRNAEINGELADLDVDTHWQKSNRLFSEQNRVEAELRLLTSES